MIVFKSSAEKRAKTLFTVQKFEKIYIIPRLDR
jgi:hypothetical protein